MNSAWKKVIERQRRCQLDRLDRTLITVGPCVASGIAQDRAIMLGFGRVDYPVGVAVEKKQPAVGSNHEYGMVSALDQILNNHQIEVVVSKAGGAQHLQFGDGIILTITAPSAQRFRGCRPVIRVMKLYTVADEGDMGVDIAID